MKDRLHLLPGYGLGLRFEVVKRAGQGCGQKVLAQQRESLPDFDVAALELPQALRETLGLVF